MRTLLRPGLAAVAASMVPLHAAAQIAGPPAPAQDTARFSVSPVVADYSLDAELLRRLPLDDMRDASLLFPGVASRFGGGIAVRGGGFGEEAVFVDGVRLRSFAFGTTNLRLPVDAVGGARLHAGTFGVEYGQARSAALSYAMRSGGEAWAGGVRVASDEPAPGAASAGFNRLDASGGGPLGRTLRFFGAATLEGNRSLPVSADLRRLPVYVASGIDTMVTIPLPDGSGTTTVAIPRFVEYDAGARIPFSQRDLYSLSGRLDARYGPGSRVFLTALASREQGLGLLGSQCADDAVCALYNPQSRSGTRSKSEAVILGWTHDLSGRAGRPLALDVRLALMRDRATAGALAPGLDPAPALGFRLDDLDFLVDEDDFPVDERLVDNILHNTGRLTPFSRAEWFQYLPTQRFRMNPYAVSFGFWTEGLASRFVHARERQLQVRAALDWQPRARHRLSVGIEHTRVEAAFASTPYASTALADVWVEHPTYTAAYVQETAVLAELTVTGAIRLDLFDPNTIFARTPGYLDPDDPATFVTGEVRSELSPRLALSYQLDGRNALRAGFGWFTQVPELDEYFAGKNAGYFRFTSTTDDHIFAGPLRPLKTRAFELGYRRLLPGGWTADVALYRREDLRPLMLRPLEYEDPRVPGATAFLKTIVHDEPAAVHGADVSLASPLGRLGFARIGYSYQDLDLERTSDIDPELLPPELARLFEGLDLDFDPASLPPWGTSRHRLWEEPVHVVRGAFSLEAPEDAPRALAGLRLSGVLRVASPTDPDAPLGWLKDLDLRLGRTVRVAGIEGELWLDARNALDWELEVDDAELNASINGLVHRHQLQLGEGTVRDVDLSSLEAAGGAVGDEVNLVLLRRAEARFGNGDGMFSVAEQDRAFRSAVTLAAVAGQDQLAGRRIRAGLSLRF